MSHNYTLPRCYWIWNLFMKYGKFRSSKDEGEEKKLLFIRLVRLEIEVSEGIFITSQRGDFWQFRHRLMRIEEPTISTLAMLHRWIKCVNEESLSDNERHQVVIIYELFRLQRRNQLDKSSENYTIIDGWKSKFFEIMQNCISSYVRTLEDDITIKSRIGSTQRKKNAKINCYEEDKNISQGFSQDILSCSRSHIETRSRERKKERIIHIIHP